MASLSKKEHKLIEVLINLKQNDTKEAMSSYLKSCYTKVVETDEYIYAVGDIPIALCAHMDTVWEDYKGGKKHLYYDKQKECMWCPEGAGFDDKVGLFLIIKIVESGLLPHIILSTNEETGCIGAGALAKEPCPFEDLRYCIELDRMGHNDCVFYNCDNYDFEKYVETFGFKTDWGSFTDICRFCPSWGIAGVNLSVGYYEEHTTNERLYVKPMLRTLSRVKKMLTAKEIPSFAYIPYVSRTKTIVSKPYSFYGYGCYDDDWEDDYPTENDYAYCYLDKDDERYWETDKEYWNRYLNFKTCSICGAAREEDSTLPLTLKDGSAGYVCNDCLTNDRIDWCDYCHEAFERDPGDESHICPNCKELIYYNGTKNYSTNSKAAN